LQHSQRAGDALRIKEEGFTALKLRIHSNSMAEDIRQVEEVRKAVGSEIEIMVDANQASTVSCPEPGVTWSYSRALKTAQELDRLGVVWLEEPLPKYDFEGLTQHSQNRLGPSLYQRQ